MVSTSLEIPGGYVHASYAASFAELGQPRELPGCHGWVILQPVAGFPYRDARGCYPLFACQDWSQLPEDLEALNGEIISLAMVMDPFGSYDQALLKRCFPEVLLAYKEHYVIDLERWQTASLPDNHQRNVKRAVQQVRVEECKHPLAWSEDWTGLYANLVRRHTIHGAAAFSSETLIRQLQVPGIVMFRAAHGRATVGMVVWYVQGQVGYYHLGAYSDLGYELRASFALFFHSIDYFSNRLRYLNLGAGAGVNSSRAGGLERFKRGWATGTRTAYFCGRIYDRIHYDEVAAARGVSGDNFFPIYRKDEI